MNKIAMKKTAQDIQDEIFSRMSADRKLELGAQLWHLAMLLSDKKMKYENKRSSSTFNSSR